METIEIKNASMFFRKEAGVDIGRKTLYHISEWKITKGDNGIVKNDHLFNAARGNGME